MYVSCVCMACVLLCFAVLVRCVVRCTAWCLFLGLDGFFCLGRAFPWSSWTGGALGIHRTRTSLPYMEYIIKVLLQFDLLQIFICFAFGFPPFPRVQCWHARSRKKKTPPSPSIFDDSVKKHNEKLTLLRLMESISKVDLYGKNSIVDSTVPPTP